MRNASIWDIGIREGGCCTRMGGVLGWETPGQEGYQDSVLGWGTQGWEGYQDRRDTGIEVPGWRCQAEEHWDAGRLR